MSFEEVRQTIEDVRRRVDFGEYEMDVYLAVLEHGTLTPSEIADRTAVPQTRVYDTVRKLSDRGMVEIRESRPMRVVAINPEEVFPDIETALSDVTDELAARYTAPARDTEAVSLVKSPDTIRRYLEDVIQTAEYELTLSLTPDLLSRYEEELAAVRRDDVVVELLLFDAADAPSSDEYDYGRVANVTRARRGITAPVLAVADGEYSVYATRRALTGGEDLYGVIFNRSELGFLAAGFFNTVLWTTAETVHAETDLGSFPRRYASIRRCIKDLQAIDDDCYAIITGRDVVTGAVRSVEGPVSDAMIEDSSEVASITVATDDGPVTIGGRVAALEDVEAHEIEIRREPP